MLRRFQYVNIPTDIMRSVACIVELGSYSKAAERLGLSQPAISAQIKRLQVLVGGAVFERTAGGVELNERGKLLMPLLRKALEANDQILQIGGAAQDPRPLRIGVSFVYGERIIRDNSAAKLRGVNFICDHSVDLMRGLADGYIDVCAAFAPVASAGKVISHWKEKLVWIRSADFSLSAGAPVPLISWPGMLLDQISIKLLEANGIAYRLAFTSFEQSCRFAAVRAGLGVMITPDWAIPDGLVAAKEYYLPPIPPVEAAIMISHTVSDDGVRNATSLLSTLAPVA